jgi:hypothetical protein
MLAALVMVGLGAVTVSGGLGAIARWRQAGRERELVVSWKRLGSALEKASARLGLDASKAPDPWVLASAPSDTLVSAGVDTLEAKVWKELSRRGREQGMDSLREALRRDRERLGLALAHCREGTRSAPSKWFLVGYPER